jgi:hypothetical protein
VVVCGEHGDAVNLVAEAIPVRRKRTGAVRPDGKVM